MWGKALIFNGVFLLRGLNADGHCIDTTHHIVSQGLYYVPGPNPCTFCLCDKGGPKFCKPVYCKQPQNCKSFHAGENCCEFVCLDDILKHNANNTFKDTYKETYDLALRLIASAVFIILTLSLFFFVIHRFRRHKLRIRQSRQLNDDQRSLNNIGYIAGSLGYLPGSIGYLGSGNNDLEFHYEDSNAHFALWKPPGNYFPRGEAPPPYEEAVRTAHLETDFAQQSSVNSLTNTTTNQPSNRTSQSSTVTPCRHQHLTNRATQEYANITVETVMLSQQDTGRSNAQDGNTPSAQCKPLKTCDKSKGYENLNKKTEKPTTSTNIKSRQNHVSKISQDNKNHKAHKYENVVFKNSSATKGLLNTFRTLERAHRENDICYENIEPCYENMRHRTIPNEQRKTAGTKETKSRDTIYVLENCTRKDLNKSNYGERSETNLRNLLFAKDKRDVPLHRTLPKNLKELMISVSSAESRKFENENYKHRSLPKQLGNQDAILSVSFIKSQINLSQNDRDTLLPKIVDNIEASSSSSPRLSEFKVDPVVKEREDQRTFNSYQYLSSQDEDDYRSECENCKSLEIINVEDEDGDVFSETMTLQRRPEISEEVPYYRTSLTLPTQIKKPKAVTPNPNREGWFMAMQETSSSEESD